MHNVVTWDHRDPNDFRDSGRNNITRRHPSVQFSDSTITSAAEPDDRTDFEVTDENKKVFRGRELVLAMGVTDIMPEIPGFAELWGHSIFHCLPIRRVAVMRAQPRPG